MQRGTAPTAEPVARVGRGTALQADQVGHAALAPYSPDKRWLDAAPTRCAAGCPVGRRYRAVRSGGQVCPPSDMPPCSRGERSTVADCHEGRMREDHVTDTPQSGQSSTGTSTDGAGVSKTVETPPHKNPGGAGISGANDGEK